MRLVVLHTAEGALTYQALGNFFASPSSGVSSHVGIDDTPNTVGEYVRPEHKAWTAGNANPIAVQAELCTFAGWSPAEWDRTRPCSEHGAIGSPKSARAIGIPMSQADARRRRRGARRGVCQHVDLGSWGGGHWDCGPGFPMDAVLAVAAGSPGHTAPPDRKGQQMIASTSTGDGYWIAKPDGAVYCFGDAQYHGGGNDPDGAGPGTGSVVPPGHVIVGIAGRLNDGYWLTTDEGSVYCFGSAQYYGRADR